MKVIYASDNNYFTYVYASVKSLLSNNDNSEIEISYIQQEVSQDNIQLLKSLGKEYSNDIEIIAFQMPKQYKTLPSYGSSKTTWAKFLFASMYPNDDRVLFLDPDTLVLGDISKLFEVDMENNLIAGVPECLPEYHRKASKLSDDDIYINGGVVLCNLKLWRKEDFETKALDRLSHNFQNLNYDQGVINELCKGRVLLLPAKYNVLAEMFELKSSKKIKQRFGFKKYYSQKEIEEAVDEPVIVHFTGFLYLKPYSIYCTHPYAKTFESIIKVSPLKFKFNEDKLNKKQIFRKWVLHNLPYGFFLFIEKIFDIRRDFLLRKTTKD